VMIWVESAIQYIQLAPDRVFSTESGHPYPEAGYNAFSLRDLLRVCDPPVIYEEVAELCAVIEVHFRWRCDVDANLVECNPHMYAKRLDNVFDSHHIGFTFKSAEYISEEERVLNTVSGVRMFFRTSGEGRRVSIAVTVQTFALNSSLFALASILTDLLMMEVFMLRRKYIARKFEEVEDMSEYMEMFMAAKYRRDMEGHERQAATDKSQQEQADELWKQQREESWM